MAKIIVEYDTVEKTGTVKQDGKELPNVNYVHMNPSYDDPDEMCMCLGYMEEDETNDTKMSYMLTSSLTKEGQEFVKKGQPLHKDFTDFVICKSESSVRKNISDFLSQ